MYAAPHIDPELLQKAARQPARHHRYVGHDAAASQQRAHSDIDSARREKQLLDDLEVTTRMDESLRDTPLPLLHARPVAARLDDPEALRLDGMRLIFLRLRRGWIPFERTACAHLYMMWLLRRPNLLLKANDLHPVFAERAVHVGAPLQPLARSLQKHLRHSIVRTEIS